MYAQKRLAELCEEMQALLHWIIKVTLQFHKEREKNGYLLSSQIFNH